MPVLAAVFMNKKSNKVYFKQAGDGSVTALFNDECSPQVVANAANQDELRALLDRIGAHTAVFLAYREDQWEALRAAAVDRDELKDTWKEWDEEGKKYLAEFKARGIPYVWVPFDVEECQRYCQERGIRNTIENRILFARRKHEAEQERSAPSGSGMLAPSRRGSSLRYGWTIH